MVRSVFVCQMYWMSTLEFTLKRPYVVSIWCTDVLLSACSACLLSVVYSNLTDAWGHSVWMWWTLCVLYHLIVRFCSLTAACVKSVLVAVYLLHFQGWSVVFSCSVHVSLCIRIAIRGFYLCVHTEQGRGDLCHDVILLSLTQYFKAGTVVLLVMLPKHGTMLRIVKVWSWNTRRFSLT